MKARQRTVRQKLRYRFDNTISRGTLPVIGYLAGLTLVAVLLAALALTLTGTKVTGQNNSGFTVALGAADRVVVIGPPG